MSNKPFGSASCVLFARLSLFLVNSGDLNFSNRLGISQRGLAWARHILFLGAALLPLAAFSAAQTATLATNWYQLSPATSPSKRFATALTYDSAHHQVVMFSGLNAPNDTWLWDGSNWTQANPATSPTPRSAQAMAYDAAHGQVVMFGGAVSGTRVNETWLWDGTNWTQAFPANSPSARNGTQMVYDTAHGKVILFGGVDAAGHINNETWSWDGTNWTQAAPANSPAGRDLAGMAYDAAHGQVVMFGGYDAFGNYDNETWVWDGTNWTQVNPANQPSGREDAAMAYDAALGQVVLFGGYDGSSYVNDTWTWDGTNWTQQSPANSPSARTVENAITYDAAHGQIFTFGGYNGGSQFNDSWVWQFPGNFGNVNVCPSGQSTPAPCSSTVPFTFNFAQDSTILSIKVVTQGVAGLDFSQANGGNCAGTITAGNSCVLDVTFNPLAPGLRAGAVQISINSGGATQLETFPIYGIGQGPQVVYGPAFSGTAILGGPSLENVLTTAGFTPNARGMTTDVAGNLYIADPAYERVLVRASNGTTNTLVGTLGSPQDVAIDGAGNLFVADTGLREVVEFPAGCVTAACQVPVYNPATADPVAVVVDGQGNLFIADPSAGGVVEVPAGCASTSCYIPIGSGWHSVNTLALDAAGDLFVPDTFAGSLIEMPAGCTTNSCRVAVGPGWIAPQGIAVDAAGDLFVSDNAAAGGMGAVTEVPAGCVSSSCEIPLVTGIVAYDLAVDQLGQVYAVDGQNHRILQINQSQPPTESFATSNVGYLSTDSPQSLTVLNVGNQPLHAISPGLVTTGPNFIGVPGLGTPADCSPTFSLAPGASCNLSISFDPQIGGNLLGTSVLTDNNLNAALSTQTIALSGSALVPSQILNVTGAGVGSGFVTSSPSGITCNVLLGIVTGTCSTNFSGGSTISLQAVASPLFTFTGWGGDCASAGTNQTCSVVMNSTTNVSVTFSLSATYTLTVTPVGTGSGSINDDQSHISCSIANGAVAGTCAGSYPGGTLVKLTANATGTSAFAGWGGACASSGSSATCTVTTNSALNATASFVAPGQSQTATLQPITAGVVYGQGGSLTSSTLNNGGVSANSLSNTQGMVVDKNGNLYVSDGGNNRVLFYPAGSTTATRVYGQGGSFTSNTGNNGGVNANSLLNPQGIAVDGSGNVYITDQYNNRVLFYPAGSTTATKVYGQSGSLTSGTTNNGGVSADSLFSPMGIALDSGGNLYVADYGNSRVLFYPAGTTTATQVYGQSGSFISNAPNNGGISANSLNQAVAVALDSSGDLYVADIYNNRVLFYPVNSTTATQVYGQGGSFTTSGAGANANSLNNPLSVAVDSNGGLYVVDRSNNRMLFYPFGSTTATRVYGQLNSFTSNSANNGGTSANSLAQPWSVATDASSNVYVADYGNNRVLEYGNFGPVNVCPTGQSTPAPCNNTITLSYYAASAKTFGTQPQVVTQGAPNLDFTLGSGSTCIGTVSAGTSCTVNVKFTPLAPGLRMGAVGLLDYLSNPVVTAPVYGIGQGPAIAFSPGTQSTLPLSGLNGVSSVAVDAAGNVFVSENAGAVKITPGNVQTTVPTTGITLAYDVAVDGAGNVFLADLGGNQVVKVTPGGVQTVVPATGLSNPTGVAVDGAGNVFITDRDNNRVVKVTPGGVQTTVPTSGLVHPYYPAVDAAGDVFVLDTGNGRVLKVTPGGIQSTIPTNGLASGNGVAVDAAGDVFVSDQIANVILEISPSGVVSTVPTSGLSVPAGLAVDAAGNLFIAVNEQTHVVKVNRSQAPSLSFATTNVGATSTDSPKIVTLQNVGNQPLTGSPTLNLGANFTQNTPLDCSSAFPLNPGAACSESFSFTPQIGTTVSGTDVFTDNALNANSALQTINLSGTGVQTAPITVTVPNVVGQSQTAASAAVAAAGLTLGTVSTASSSSVPSGSVISQNPAAGTQAVAGSAVQVLVSTGPVPQPTTNPLTLQNNYLVTGDYASAGVTLRGTGQGGSATGTISISNSAGSHGVPDGADILAAYLYWESLENTASPSSASGTFRGYPITGQQIGSDQPFTDGALSGTLRVYRADVNAYLPLGANGIRLASGSHTVSLPDGGSSLPLTEGASLVIIYRVLSPNVPLKGVVIYDGSAVPTTSTMTQTVQGFYDAVSGANGTGVVTNLFAAGGSWNNNTTSTTLGQADQFTATLNPGSAYAAVIVSTPVNNSDNDGILDAWKAGPPTGDFHAAQPGYYDVKTGAWVGLPGAQHGHKDLFVQLDYMCGAVLSDGTCDPAQENLFPSPDTSGNDPLAMVQQAFAASGVQLHLQIGNAVPEDTCTDATSAQLCQFPNQPGVIGWKNSLEFSKLWPRNFASCATGGDCTTRFPYGQKDSYHYVLFGHSLAVPAWNTRYGTLTSINVANNVTTIGTVDRGTGINQCPSRITISGVLGNPSLNGVYNTTGCSDSKTISLATPGVPNWNYPNNTLPEPVIGLTSGTITSISGYSDLGGADSAVTLGLWLTAPNQDMSKKANVIAGTLFHEIGHTLGLSHGGLYYDTPNSYVPTFEGNCKPNYQSVMNYLFQLDLVGPNHSLAYSNQTLTTLSESTASLTTQLTDLSNSPATFPTSAWYVPVTSGTLASPATRHCDGTPLNNDSSYRVDAQIAPITPAWANGQDINFDGQLNAQMRGYNDVANMDLRQVGATGGEFASLATVLSFGSSAAPLNINAGGNVTLGSGGTIALGSGGNVTLGSGGNVTLGSGGTITMGSGGNVTLGSGGNVTLGSGGTVTPGSSGIVTLSIGGNVTLGSGGTITLGSGGNVTLGSGGTVTLGSGGTIALGSGGTVTLGSGGTYTIDSSGGTITLGSGGNVTLGSGGNVTLGSGGTIALGSGGNVTLGSGGNVTLGSGGTIALGSGGTIALGSGGNVTLGSGGTIALGSGGTITLGSGGNVTLGSGGTVTLGSGGVSGSGGNVTLGSGGTATLGAGGTVTLGSGGNVTLGSGGNVTLGSGGTITMGSGGNVTLGSGGTVTLGSGGDTITVSSSGGTVTLGSGGNVTLGSGGTIALGSGGTVTIPPGGSYNIDGSGGTITLGSGGNVTLGSGGNVTLGSGGTIALGSGGNVTLGSGGNVTLGSGGTITLGSGGNITLGSGGTVTLGSGGVVALGSGGNVTLGSGGTIALGSGGNITLGSGGTLSDELTYETANSIVRPPSSPTETTTPVGVRVNWTAPAFGVVSTYAIYRSSNGATPVLIGSVSGVNGNPPATEFIDTNPDLTSQTVVYTISTTLAPVVLDPTQRQSPASPPAVLTNDQSISLGPLPSSVTLGNSPTVTATAMSSGTPNGLQVSFTATGTCSIGSQSIAGGVSSASVILNSSGSCTITASQPGSNPSQSVSPPYYNAANSVSGTFAVVPQGSSTTSQTINFPLLQSLQYGNTFTLSASSSAGLPVSFTASGPCTTNGTVTGVGVCAITASAPASGAYSAASVSQSFTIFPAVLKVTATSLTSAFGQALPSLTYSYSGFVNSETAAVVSGTPALSTTATSASTPGTYPITVSTGTLAAKNYSFLYVSGTLTITGPVVAVSPSSINFGTVPQGSITTKNITVSNVGTAPVTINQPILSIVRGGNSNEFVAVNLCPTPLAAGKSCTITIAFIAGAYYTPQTATLQIMSNAPGSPQPVTLSALVLIPQTIAFTTNPPASAANKSTFTVAATGGASGNAVTFTSSGACSNVGATYTMTSGTGTCSVIANQAGNASYAPAAQVTKSVTASLATQTITFTTNPPASAIYKTSFTVAATGGASGNAVTFTSSGACTNSGATYTMSSGTGTCSVTANQAGNSTYAAATAVTKTVAANTVAQTITFTTNPPASATYKTSFTVAATGGASGNAVTFTSSGACTNAGATYTMSSGTGTCSVIANQAGNSNYVAAAQVTKTVTASLATQTITFTTNPPASAAYKTTFAVVATGGASGNAVSFTSSGACTNSGATYTMSSGTGTCSVIANQAGNSNYAAATAVTKTVSAVYSQATLSPASVSFGTVASGKSSTAKTVTLSNTGTTPLIINSISFTGTNPSNFVQTNTCSSSLAAGKSCTISVTFNSSGKAASANLAVADNTQTGTQTVSLSGD